MGAVRVTAHGLLVADVCVRYHEEVTRAEDVQREDINILRGVELLALLSAANLKVIGVVLSEGRALDLYAEQNAIAVKDEVIGQEVADGHRHAEASAEGLRGEELLRDGSLPLCVHASLICSSALMSASLMSCLLFRNIAPLTAPTR